MKTYRVECGPLVEHAVLELDLPVVCCAMLREAGAVSVNIYEEAIHDSQN
jgi:hypothetical protein